MVKSLILKLNVKKYIFFLIGLSMTTSFYHEFIHDNLLHTVSNKLLKHSSESYELNSLSELPYLKELSLNINGGKHKVFYSKFKAGEGPLFFLDYDIQVQNLKGVTKENGMALGLRYTRKLRVFHLGLFHMFCYMFNKMVSIEGLQKFFLKKNIQVIFLQLNY